ncbi:uncharacterized protein LOC110637782 isoform X3 [Hevea brasiliensis]|uniref:uncharacterized protein LOC110637782 isoform X3 n=1 Tax=Hevea brasiliensis TaxID=3981 RepID=UPI000B78B1CB|nr:uncharacterized protein LOC110637782 isoform X3 [Hevea brasiliensis]
MVEEILIALKQMHPTKAPGPDEGLSSLLKHAKQMGRLHGVKLPAPPVSHLFVADDSLLFGRATPDEADAIRSLLTTYERASGQQINVEKSELTTSKCVYSHLRSELRGRIGDRQVDQSSKYLGLPSVLWKSKRIVFRHIKDRVWNKVKS